MSRPPRGGRGLKYIVIGLLGVILVSPPSRGAWIEIFSIPRYRLYDGVAPLAGGVD